MNTATHVLWQSILRTIIPVAVGGILATVIAKDNKLTNPNEIMAGQELTIRPGARVHVVDKGESFWGIGRRYGLTPERLAALNGKKTSDTIHPGDILRLA